MLLPDDFFNLMKKGLFTEWAASFTLVLNPIAQHMLLGVSEVLLVLLSMVGRAANTS